MKGRLLGFVRQFVDCMFGPKFSGSSRAPNAPHFTKPGAPCTCLIPIVENPSPGAQRGPFRTAPGICECNVTSVPDPTGSLVQVPCRSPCEYWFRGTWSRLPVHSRVPSGTIKTLGPMQMRCTLALKTVAPSPDASKLERLAN